MNDPAELVIDHESPVPVYRQLVDNLRALLVEQVLRPGELLPTVRQMGLDLGIHFNTVAEAYRLLAAEGWLELRRGRGAEVLRREARDAGPEAEEDFVRSLRQLMAQARSDGLGKDYLCNELERMIQELSE